MFRFIDTEMNQFLPHNDYSIDQILSLEQALKPIIHRIDQLYEFIQIAKSKCHFPSEHNLTYDESAAIFLYTMKWNNNIFYQTIKRDLHSKDLSISQSWLPYLILFNNAIKKLPNTRLNVWRGVNKDICKKFKTNDEFILSSNTSCSLSDQIITNCLELNSILCFIEAVNGKDISIYSYFPNQNEIILCSGIRLRVVNSNTNNQSTSLPILHLQECDHSSMENKRSRIDDNQISSLVPHFIVLIIALLLIMIIGKTLTSFESSYITTSCYQAIKIIFPLKNKFNHTTIHTHVDIFGNRYEGELLHGKKHGKGTMYFANGYKYIGDWIDDMATGECIFIWTNGDRYEGQIKNGQRHGKGSYYFSNGDKYIGDWIHDKKEGYGISSLTIGQYEGQFKNDNMHGKGSFYFTDGSTYIGDWIDSKQDGEGTFTWINGDRYEGHFKVGKLHGHGSYYFGNGNKFTGDWIDGERMTDHGVFTWANDIRNSEENNKH